MSKTLFVTLAAAASAVGWPGAEAAVAAPIDREALVKRHAVTISRISESETLQVGNGEVAYGIDPTGLQTFHGNTMSQWGWHSVPCPAEGGHAALKLADWDYHGRKLPYRSSAKDQEALYTWMRENPHRANLGRLRFLIKKADGSLIASADVKDIRQKLDLWTGVVTCDYTVEGIPAHVEVCADRSDALAVKAESALLAQGRMAVEIAFPYGHPGKSGADWKNPGKHTTVWSPANMNDLPASPFIKGGCGDFTRAEDGFRYHVRFACETAAELKETAPHTFVLSPRDVSVLAFTFHPRPDNARTPPAGAASPVSWVRDASARWWPMFWQSGGAVDLSGSKDPRWRELERRIVLSQYLLAVNEAGSLPPQESGLYNNSGWYGKFHLEMHWWHGAHYALWNRWPFMQNSLDWYFKTLPKAKALAASQGFTGARWPKMVGPDAEDSPSGTGPMLIWQQPHPIFYAMLEYRQTPSPATLEKWAELIDETAEFMASFAFLDEARGQYVLGPPVATVPENSHYATSINPAFELSYWRTGLRWAQAWREKRGKPRVAKWDDVLARLAPLPVRDGVYLSQETMPDTYTKMNWEHPSLIGPRGMLPGDGTDPAVVAATVDAVWSAWQWNRCWGWDFPMMAMAAARNGRQDMAVDALLHASGKNAFNGTGLSTGGPFPYFPSNGGLLYAVALMAAGWDGAPSGIHAPGFPQDGSWQVKWENLAPAP